MSLGFKPSFIQEFATLETCFLQCLLLKIHFSNFLDNFLKSKNKWEDFWKNKGSKIYHFIGKDNIPFHTILFPAEIMAEGTFNLPYNVVGLQYLNYERGKFSKSAGRGIFCENLPNAGLEADYWRFYLSYVIPETGDTEFLWDEFRDRINGDLIGNFSNFINRSLSLSWKNFDGNIKGKIDNKFKKEIDKKIKKILELFENVELRGALKEILKLSSLGNKYIDNKAPWKTKDIDVLFNCANLTKVLGLLIQPYLPKTSIKILKMINCNEKDWSNLNEFNIIKLNKPDLLFKKLDDELINSLKKKTSKVTEFKIK